VRLYTRPGNDLIHRFPLIVETLARLRSRSCIDGEDVACDDNGVASFDLVRHRFDHAFVVAGRQAAQGTPLQLESGPAGGAGLKFLGMYPYTASI
jgi:ATP-dependent DNA ligase